MKIFDLIPSILRCLPKKFHLRFWLMLALLLLQSILELLSLGSIIPVTSSLADPSLFFSRGIGLKIVSLLPGFDFFQLGLLILAAMLALFLVKNVVSQLITNFQARFVYQIFENISVLLHRHYLDSSFTEIHARPSAEIVRDIFGVPQRFATNIVLATLLLLTELFAIVFISIGIFWYEPLAFLCAALVFVPPLSIFYLWIRRRIQTIDASINEMESSISTSLYESIEGYLDILTTGSKFYFLDRYRTLVQRFSYLLSSRTIFGTIPVRLAEGSMILGIISLFLYSKVRDQNVTTMTAIFGIYILGAYRLLPSANRITLCLLSIRGNLFSMDTAALVANQQEPPKTLPESNALLPFLRDIRLKNISYRYPKSNADVLQGIDLTIQKGECLGIAGPSGAGKSTLLHLILGALSPTQGSIFVDDEVLTPEKLTGWRRSVGYVQQNVFLLSGTIKENITFGLPETSATIDQIRRCVDMASLSSVVENLPNKLDTVVGDGGQQLSFGQRQRIGIARAIFHGAQVIIFDEPTSALDPKTEQDIKDSIRQLQREKFTILLVSHKTSSLTVCDRIITIDQGTIITSTDEG